ncbi:MAG: phosphorylase family protein [Candidatus Hodarchaeales archaeon]
MERDRTEQYKGAFEKVKYELKGGVFHGITGTIADTEVSAIYSKSPADIADCVAFLGMSKTKCNTIFSTGSIGGIGDKVEMGDFVIGEDAVGNDGYSQFNARKRGIILKDFFSNIIHPRGNVADLVQKCVQEKVEEFSVHFHRGRIFTIPSVSLETKKLLKNAVNNKCLAVDMETAPFYAACNEHNFNSLVIHWVTDLPLSRSFFYKFTGDQKIAKQDWEKKHPIWLNMSNILVSILECYIQNLER